MSNPILGRQDVYHAVIERIRAGDFAPGAKLPSCRDLARDIGSNPNTVHRVLKDLEGEGVVRSVPRKGTFVTGHTSIGEHDWLGHELAKLVSRAVAAGISPSDLMQQLSDEVGRVVNPATIYFPECNVEDAEEMAGAVTQATGLELAPVLIDELSATIQAARDDGLSPLVVVPLFHLGEVRALDLRPTPIVEVAFLPDPESLVQIASLEPSTTVTVASRLERGVDRLASIVRQYFGGAVEERLLTDEEQDFADTEVLVHNNASQLTLAERRSAPREVKISVVLEGRSIATLAERITLVTAHSVPKITAAADPAGSVR